MNQLIVLAFILWVIANEIRWELRYRRLRTHIRDLAAIAQELDNQTTLR